MWFGVIVALRVYWWFAPLLALLVFQVFRARREGQVLRQAFGQAYLDYRKQTWC
jgi:protein-S-isoprenylcysteine O-methyltransferase Ste14